MFSLAKIEITPKTMALEGSWGARGVGSHASTMELYERDDGSLFIEWDIPSLGETECIGLTFEGRELVDYDGVGSIPLEAVSFLREQGYHVSDEFVS